jgi:hypothetical protein
VAEANLTEKRRAVSGIQMFFLAIAEGVDSFARSLGGEPSGRTFLADLELRAESAANVFAVDDDLRSRLAEEAADLIGDDEGALGGGMDDRIFAVRFDHQTVGL